MVWNVVGVQLVFTVVIFVMLVYCFISIPIIKSHLFPGLCLCPEEDVPYCLDAGVWAT